MQIFCEENESSAVAELWFSKPETVVKSLLHNKADDHSIQTLALFTVIYFFLACVTCGMTISIGTFIPSVLIGASSGRLMALVVLHLWPKALFMVPGKYGLIGAAAFMGGFLRMTICATVLLMEATDVSPTFAIPLILTQMIAKWVGDKLCDGLLEIIIEQKHIPFLQHDPPPNFTFVRAYEIMKSPVICFRIREKAGFVYKTLMSCKHNGFPIVDDVEGNLISNGRLCGLVQRYQMLVIFLNGYYEETKDSWESEVSLDSFRALYPDYPGIEVSNSGEKSHYVCVSNTYL